MGEVGFTVSLVELVVGVVGIVITFGLAFTKIIFYLLDKRITRLEYKLRSPPIADKLAALRLSSQLHDEKILEGLGDILKAVKETDDMARRTDKTT